MNNAVPLIPSQMESPPLTVTPLTAADVDAAYALVFDEPDMLGQLLWHTRTPYAFAVKIHMWDLLSGFAYGMVHGHTGWIREVYVHAGDFNLGMGSAMVKALLQWMEEQGTTAQGVVARPGTENFWMKHGFVPEQELLGYSEGKFYQATRDEVIHLEPQHLLGVLHLDRRATGEDRSTYLREHFYLGIAWIEGTKVRGFQLPLLGRGVCVADSPLVGFELQRWAFNLQNELVLPAGQTEGHEQLLKEGHTTRPLGLRMWRGDAPTMRPEMIYSWHQGVE